MPLAFYTLPAAFKNAWSGILRFFQLERNGQIQGMVAVLAVAAVLWASIASAVVGLLLFLPYLRAMVGV